MPYRPMTVRPKTNWRKRTVEKSMKVILVFLLCSCGGDSKCIVVPGAAPAG